MNTPFWLAAVAAGGLAAPALAQDQPMDHGHHPAPQPGPAPAAVTTEPTPPIQRQDGMQHGAMGAHAMDHQAMDHQGMDHQAMHHDAMDHGAMEHGAMAHDMMAMPEHPANSTAGSGTSRLPAAEGEMHGLHAMAGDWMLMAHGAVWGVHTDQSGPRGDTMDFVESMAMVTAERDFAGGAHFQARTMLSLEPLMGARGYPNLFATGETAGGEALVDRQHPHDLFMELAARLDVPLGGGVTGFVYGGPVAEPALGPSAFMHRGSAKYLALAPIGHHWFDSTHITYGVVTAGVANDHFQLEASAFRGREPDEDRWDIETPRLDSWSVRATWTPTPNLAVQASHGRIESPEALHPGEDEARTTASVQYARGGLSTTLAFSAKDRLPGDTLTAWLAEANWDLSKHHSLFGRIENVANDELFPDHAAPLHDTRYRVTRFEGGYAYRMTLSGPLGLALGGSLATYAKPAALDAAYGDPFGYTLFAKLTLGG